MDTGAGMKVFDAPVTVANVVSDSDVHESGVQVFPIYSQPKYQVSIQCNRSSKEAGRSSRHNKR